MRGSIDLSGAGGTSWCDKIKRKGKKEREGRDFWGLELLGRSVSSTTLKRGPALGKGHLFHNTNAP